MTRQRGRCSGCVKEFALYKDGRVWRHWAASGPDRCPGSGQPPIGVHIHKCACGARWDEDANDPQGEA